MAMDSVVQDDKEVDRDVIDNYHVSQTKILNEQNLPWIVLLAGVFMSVMAFVSLNVYASKSTELDRTNLFQKVRNHVESRVEYAMQTVHILALEKARAPTQTPVVFNDEYLQLQKVFEGVYHVKEGQGSALDWNFIYGSNAWDDGEGRVKLYIPVKSLFRTFSQQSPAEIAREPVKGFLSDIKLDSVELKRGTDSLFIMASAVDGNAADRGVVVALGSVSQIIGHRDIVDMSGVVRVKLTQRRTKEDVYLYDTRPGWEPSETNLLQKDIMIGNIPVTMEIVVTNTVGAKVIKKLPVIFLVFGGILTIVLLLYTRSKGDTEKKLTGLDALVEQRGEELQRALDDQADLRKIVKKSDREYGAVINSISDVVFETDPQGEILELNQSWQRVTGIPYEEAVGKDLFEFINPQDQSEQRDNFREMVAGRKQAYRFFTKLRTSDDSYRAVEFAITMMKQDIDKNLRIVGSITDIEARHRAERALDETEKKYRTIVENAAGGIYQMTLEGKFLSANPAMARILGYSNSDELIERVMNAYEEIFVTSRDVGRMQRELEAIGSVHNFETEVYTQQGEKRWVNVNVHAVQEDSGALLYYEGSMEDVTQRRNAETGLREAKIQSDLANRAKSEFLANMSHELRTPLNSIIGFSEIIKDEVLGKVDNRQYWEYSRDIHDSGKKLLKIINEILDVSRIEVGERQLNEGLVKLNGVINSCVEFLSGRAEEGGLVITNLSNDSLPLVVGEELAIKQIFINLMSNAVKYTPTGGRVTVSHEVDSEGQLRVSITDTGVGLDETEIEKALSPFGQIDTALDRTGSGAGLGLTLADALIKLHGGSLELFSQKGIGTTATVVFPASRIQRKDETQAAAES